MITMKDLPRISELKKRNSGLASEGLHVSFQLKNLDERVQKYNTTQSPEN